MISNQNALLWGYGSRHDSVIENGFVEERLFSAKNIELLTIRAENWKTNARMLKLESTDFTLMLPNILVVIFFSRYYKNRLQQYCDTTSCVLILIYMIIISRVRVIQERDECDTFTFT